MGRGEFRYLSPLKIMSRMQVQYGIPSAQEEEDTLGRLELKMDRSDPTEVMMLAIEHVQLFFMAHLEGGHGMTDVQLIHQGAEKLQECGPLYDNVPSIWNAKDATFHMIWINF